MLSRSVRIASISDVHLFHKRVPTEYILQNLNRELVTDAVMSQLDILFIAGDLFDGLVSFNSPEGMRAKEWVGRLLLMCIRHGVVLRVLEGTPSHDRRQSAIFETQADLIREANGAVVDLRWVTEVEVEYFSQFGMHVLYVPDEWKHDTADTLVDVKAAIAGAGVTQVDLAIMHGQFRYQMPGQVKDHVCHQEAEYLALVKYLIFIGHVHVHSSFDRIHAQGSFDRIAHGEEGAKGYLRAEIHPDGNWSVTFVENKGAKCFVTVDCLHESVEDNIRYLDDRVRDLSNESYVRICTHRGNPILQNIDEIKKRWPTYAWTDPKILEDAKDELEELVPAQDMYIPIAITPHNLKQLVMDRLMPMQLSTDLLQRCAFHLGEMQNL